jgi:predicted dehydrogenase
MKTYRVAILGCRARGTAAARGYAAHPRTEVAALCDLLPERSDALGDELGVSARYTDLDRMLREARPDLVAVPTGTELHYELVSRVLEYGAHVDVEKPLCTDLEQADALVAKARGRGCRVAVHHQTRVSAPMRAVRQAIREGRIGEPRYLVASCKGYYGGYGVMNIGTHLINNLLGIAGRCRGVVAAATVGGRPPRPEDAVLSPGGMGPVLGERLTATLQFDNGVAATLVHQRFPKADARAYAIEIMGTEGRLFWKNRGAWHLPVPHFIPDGEDDGWQPLDLAPPDGTCRHPTPNTQHPTPETRAAAEPDEVSYVDEYVRALDEGRDHECSGEEARHVMEVMMGIFEAAAYGCRVDLPQARRDHPLLRWRREAGLGDPPPVQRSYSEWLAEEDTRIAGRA